MLNGTFSPAVYADGAICLDILQNQWSPIYDVAAILTSIQVNTMSMTTMLSSIKDSTLAQPSLAPKQNTILCQT